MIRTLLFPLLLTLSQAAEAQTDRLIQGTVRDENGQPLAGASVQAGNAAGQVTDPQGRFRLRADTGTILLEVRFLGYRTWSQTLDPPTGKNLDIQLEPSAYALQTLELIGTWSAPDDPFASSRMRKEELAERNQGQDIPWLLQSQPGVVASSDAGTGIGYTGLRIRGSDPTRTNVTINGVPLNDAESQAVFWVNMPDFASSLEQVQIQRGVGTSTNGAGAFGATVNLQTHTVREKPYAELSTSIGSFGTRRHMVSLGTGMLGGHWSIDGRWSRIRSEGYIDRATADLGSWYGSLTWQKGRTLIRALAFSGTERTFQSWWGTPQSRIENDTAAMLAHAARNGFTERQTLNLLNSGRTYNYYEYPDEVDQYTQTHYQLHFAQAIDRHWRANATLHYTRGAGYFEQFREGDRVSNYGLEPVAIGGDTLDRADFVRRRWLDNHFAGAVANLRWEKDAWEVHAGGGWNIYLGDHHGRIIWASLPTGIAPNHEYYRGDSRKTDGNLFVKTSARLGSGLTAFGDLQYRTVDYRTQGRDNDLRPYAVDERLGFFNPKAGLTWEPAPSWNLYASLAVGHREPSRKDYVDAPDEAMPQPERLVNTEGGVRFRRDRWQAEVNAYHMHYRDQLVPTGALNDVGATLLTNVPRSWRLGIETSWLADLGNGFTWEGNLCLSRNRIAAFEEILYDYTDGFEEVRIPHRDVDIAFSPSTTGNSILRWKSRTGFSLAWMSRHVGRQFLDNTSNPDRALPAWWVNDLFIGWQGTLKGLGSLEIDLQVNNLLDRAYSNNGYTYSYIYGETVTENFFYPQAGRHLMVGATLKF